MSRSNLTPLEGFVEAVSCLLRILVIQLSFVIVWRLSSEWVKFLHDQEKLNQTIHKVDLVHQWNVTVNKMDVDALASGHRVCHHATGRCIISSPVISSLKSMIYPSWNLWGPNLPHHEQKSMCHMAKISKLDYSSYTQIMCCPLCYRILTIGLQFTNRIKQRYTWYW